MFMTRARHPHRAALLFVPILLSASLVGHRPAPAQRAERFVVSPPAAQILRTRPDTSPSVPSPAFGASPAIAGEARLDLNIVYTRATIRNPETGLDDEVRLRTYRDINEKAPPEVPFIAPTIEITPGETVRINLKNDLPQEDPSCQIVSNINLPHCFNRTNLHSHGLWISPTGNGDNVFLSINPSVSFEYEYNLPLDHPAGTFWYHPHLHGSTAIQVSSGMAGLLIVRGDRLPTPQSAGDVDTILKYADNTAFTQRPLLLQQIQYACFDADRKIQQDANGKYLCLPGQIGEIESYDRDHALKIYEAKGFDTN